ncbi:GatB/YqeY domain-containing protein [Kitasatospora sp. RB6PN24]|uniref:GatB/YqeY domain-containing protein n=1 Tax=Kitasatospora humi TaxID=2893891 RepID=UPI001E51941A|nr:GatB/YqeY domain-containing protein [Kitasatospora humi]MCC9308065.1 GatB/YqeY domain-containing protein [Kitasatospora humi]
MVNATGSALRERLRAGLTEAMRGRDRATAGVLRVALGVLQNAEAVERDADADRNLAIGRIPVGAGAAEAPRRQLTEAEDIALLAAEVAEREAAAEQYEQAGQSTRAEQLRVEARVLAAYLD